MMMMRITPEALQCPPMRTWFRSGRRRLCASTCKELRKEMVLSRGILKDGFRTAPPGPAGGEHSPVHTGSCIRNWYVPGGDGGIPKHGLEKARVGLEATLSQFIKGTK